MICLLTVTLYAISLITFQFSVIAEYLVLFLVTAFYYA